MATITVVSPKTIYPGKDSFFTQYTEADSVTVAALRWVLLNTAGNWLAVATDPLHLLGTNMVAGANITTGKSATDIFVYTPNTIVEANTNSSGTDPVPGAWGDVVVATNAHQFDLTVTTAMTTSALGTPVWSFLRNSPKDASLDTNIRAYAIPRAARLQFFTAI